MDPIDHLLVAADLRLLDTSEAREAIETLRLKAGLYERPLYSYRAMQEREQTALREREMAYSEVYQLRRKVSDLEQKISGPEAKRG